MARLSPAEVFDEPKRAAAAAQAPVVEHGRFFLAGGTALALHLGHRLSRDLDWFTAERFDGARLAKALPSLSLKPTQIVQSGPDTVRAFYGTLETSFIHYSAVAARPVVAEVGTLKIPVADLETLAAMKAGAVINRGAKRDFVDIHALVRSPGWSMERFVTVGVQMLGVAPAQLRLGLTYFTDADQQPSPDGVRTSWDQVKRELLREIQALDRKREPGLDR